MTRSNRHSFPLFLALITCVAISLLLNPSVARGGYFSDLKQKASQGDDASRKLIKSIFDDDDDDLRNIDEAIRCEIAAESGVAEAQNTLAWFYWLNDYDAEAVFWFEKSAEQNYIESILLLSEIYRGDYGSVDTDLKRAEMWLLRGIDAGSPEAQFELGKLYQKQKKHTKALAQFKIAAEHDYRPAKKELSRCYLLGKGTSINPAMAFKNDPYTLSGFLFFIAFAGGGFIYRNRSDMPTIFLIFGGLGSVLMFYGLLLGG